jgi:hypothetical protein
LHDLDPVGRDDLGHTQQSFECHRFGDERIHAKAICPQDVFLLTFPRKTGPLEA